MDDLSETRAFPPGFKPCGDCHGPGGCTCLNDQAPAHGCGVSLLISLCAWATLAVAVVLWRHFG